MIRSGRIFSIIALFFFAGTGLFAQQAAEALENYRSGDFERAVELCREEITSNSANLEAYVIISWSLVRLRRYEEARTYALTGRNLSRYDSRITEILGEIYYYQGRNNEALRQFQEYFNLAPEGSRRAEAYYFTGELYIRLGKFQHADIAFSMAVYIYQRNAYWWTRLAYAREKAGETQSAISAYERALELNAQLADARSGLERVRQSSR